MATFKEEVEQERHELVGGDPLIPGEKYNHLSDGEVQGLYVGEFVEIVSSQDEDYPWQFYKTGDDDEDGIEAEYDNMDADYDWYAIFKKKVKTQNNKWKWKIHYVLLADQRDGWENHGKFKFHEITPIIKGGRKTRKNRGRKSRRYNKR